MLILQASNKPEMDWERARFNMIEQQIRPAEVLDQDVLDSLYVVRREEFVPEAHRALAFSDIQIPLGDGEAMMQPRIEARILQELAVKPNDKVLEIGTGSGYLTALLAHRARHVVSVEINPRLKAFGESNLRAAGVKNVTLELGDGARGWAGQAPYDVIVLTGSTPLLPDEFLQQLTVGGRLFAIVGDPPVMSARLVTCVGEGSYNTIDILETSIAPLKNAMQPERFVF
jgi:protein-L-isoaspartate(D-aspartate) O-methyltransferase